MRASSARAVWCAVHGLCAHVGMPLKISLPMYDAPGIRRHTDEFFAALYAATVPALRALSEAGDPDAERTLQGLLHHHQRPDGPPRPHRLSSDDQASAESVWDDPELLLSQMCGLPLTIRSDQRQCSCSCVMPTCARHNCRLYCVRTGRAGSLLHPRWLHWPPHATVTLAAIASQCTVDSWSSGVLQTA